MNPDDVILPGKEKDLKTFYIIINRRVNKVWIEYTTYVEKCSSPPKTTLIFPIIFSELDFYESLLERIKSCLSDEVLEDIHNEFFFSDW